MRVSAVVDPGFVRRGRGGRQTRVWGEHLLLPSAKKLRRLCFYTCLCFCSWGGGCYPSMPCTRGCVCSGGSAYSGGGVPALGVVCSRAGGVCSGGCLLVGGGCGDPLPESRQLLLWTVRILLECILVW